MKVKTAINAVKVINKLPLEIPNERAIPMDAPMAKLPRNLKKNINTSTSKNP